jgi:hypothetical protein
VRKATIFWVKDGTAASFKMKYKACYVSLFPLITTEQKVMDYNEAVYEYKATTSIYSTNYFAQ